MQIVGVRTQKHMICRSNRDANSRTGEATLTFNLRQKKKGELFIVKPSCNITNSLFMCILYNIQRRHRACSSK